MAPTAPSLSDLPAREGIELLCRTNPGVWAEERLGFKNADFHWEWYRYLVRESRLAVVAPRDFAKSQVFTVNATAHRCIYNPGLWTYVFAATLDQAEKIKERIDQTVLQASPDLWHYAQRMSNKETMYSNGSRVTVAGAGKAVRGAHPDIIIGDDVLEEGNCLTAYQRKKTADWWFGTVSNMAHPGTTRTHKGLRIQLEPTRVFLIGTPFHGQDLLMSMRDNAMYHFRRYAAEFQPGSLTDGYAVEVR